MVIDVKAIAVEANDPSSETVEKPSTVSPIRVMSPLEKANATNTSKMSHAKEESPMLSIVALGPDIRRSVDDLPGHM